MTLQPTKTKLHLDGRWNLEELSEAIRDYTQLYGFAYSLLPDLPLEIDNIYANMYGNFPWRGGYSTVHFFNRLFRKIPRNLQPEVTRIQYASPGFIELSELLLVAVTVAGIVKAVCSTINTANDTYRKILKDSVEHKLAKINLAKEELELTQKQITFCETSARQLIQVFGFTEVQKQLIDRRVQGNSAMKLKILLSVFRRVGALAKKQSEGKLKVTGNESDGI
jgi:hypothetical protein